MARLIHGTPNSFGWDIALSLGCSCGLFSGCKVPASTQAINMGWFFNIVQLNTVFQLEITPQVSYNKKDECLVVLKLLKQTEAHLDWSRGNFTSVTINWHNDECWNCRKEWIKACLLEDLSRAQITTYSRSQHHTQTHTHTYSVHMQEHQLHVDSTHVVRDHHSPNSWG